MSDVQNITVLALDVDGVLTDGTITLSKNTGVENKSFHVHDGLGISLWLKAGNDVILISGRDAACVNFRANELGINHVIQGSKDKISDLDSTLKKLNATVDQTAFVGDDLGDIPVMQHVSYAIAVNNAADEVKLISNFVTPRAGGHGAVRDAIEHLMKEAGSWQDAIASMETSTAQQ
jgi:3-deoxy-D-manno-octulosonate 8-phosphate phosphatase (KDO 8-P phosphatase)